MIGLMCLKKFMLIIQMDQKYVILDKRLKFELYLCNGCHELMQSYELYRFHIWYMIKGDAIDIMKNSDLNKKGGLL